MQGKERILDARKRKNPRAAAEDDHDIDMEDVISEEEEDGHDMEEDDDGRATRSASAQSEDGLETPTVFQLDAALDD